MKNTLQNMLMEIVENGGALSITPNRDDIIVSIKKVGKASQILKSTHYHVMDYQKDQSEALVDCIKQALLFVKE